jgi:hypothetical protein
MSENMIVRDSKQEIAPKENVELRSLPTRKYLDETVIPLLLEGLSILTKVSQYLSNTFIDNGLMLNCDVIILSGAATYFGESGRVVGSFSSKK